MPDSLLHRKLRGSMAQWDMTALLLRLILVTLQGANYQRGGGKGQKPKPIPLPTDSRGGKPAKTRSPGEKIAQGLMNLGHIPPGAVS